MNLHDAIRGRRTIQRFRPGPVPDEVVDRALEAAVLAPNHKTTWPFRFVVAGEAARQAVFEVGLALKAEKKGGATPKLEAEVRAKLLAPDRLVVVAQVLADDAVRIQEDYATCACATYAMLLSVHADGFGAKWETGGLSRDARTAQALGLDPARERIVSLVWIGVPEIVPQAPVRPALAEIVRRT